MYRSAACVRRLKYRKIRRVFNMSKSQQNYLDQVAQRLHLTADAQSGILFGMQGGLHMMLMRSTSNQNFVSLVFP